MKDCVDASRRLLTDYEGAPLGIDRAIPRFSWAGAARRRGDSQTAYRVTVATSPELLDKQSDMWDSGKVSSDRSSHVEYQGHPLVGNTAYYWRVHTWDEKDEPRRSEVASFRTAILSPDEWRAHWIGRGGPLDAIAKNMKDGIIAEPANKDQSPELVAAMTAAGRDDIEKESVLLRREFGLSQSVTSAFVHVCGLGYCELNINGKRVDEEVLGPAKTDYRLRALYDTYDVTDILRAGDNAIGVHLGGGWFHPVKKYWGWQSQYYGSPRILLQLHIELADGSKEVVVTDGQWRSCLGPVLSSCIYDGEVYDANRTQEGFDTASFDDAAWEDVKIVDAPAPLLEARMMPPVRVIEALSPVSLKEPTPGVHVYDMGQNIAGWTKVVTAGPKGSTLKIRTAENLSNDGNLDVATNMVAEATDTYVRKGSTAETYRQHFTYHGFRYVELTGQFETPTQKDVMGLALHSAVEPIGTFECDNELINRIHDCTVRTQRNNLQGLPLDCPQRNERLGWLGDAHVSAEEALYNFDMALLYEKWLKDIQLQQEDNGTGDVPHVSPRPGVNGTPDWSSAYVLIAWYCYVHSGDTRFLRDHYGNFKEYVRYLGSTAQEHILPRCRYGDWMSPNKDAMERGDPELLSTAFYFYDVSLLARMAEILGAPGDAEHYSSLAIEIGRAFNRKYFDSTSCQVGGGTQCENAVALAFALVPNEYRAGVLDNLVRNVIETHEGHLSTGIIGTKYLIDALADNGRSDVVHLLATQTSYPSWTNMLQGHTTLSEYWDSGSWYSNDHIMFGSIDTWFYQGIAGIRPVESAPGFKRVSISPFIPADMEYARATCRTIKGVVRSAWRRSGGALTLDVTIPANCTSTVRVPVSNPNVASITEGGRVVWQKGHFEAASDGVVSAQGVDGAIVFGTQSGEYSFRIKEAQSLDSRA